MKTVDAWLKLEGTNSALAKVLGALQSSGAVVSNLRLSRSLDNLSYNVKMALEGETNWEQLSSKIAVFPEVSAFELSPQLPVPPPRTPGHGCW